MASFTEIAWAAGLFEGEGCISTLSPQKGKYGPYARLDLQMNDQDVVERFGEVVGVGKTYHHRLYGWRTGNASEVLQVLRLFWPYLGGRRKARALQIAAIAATTHPAGYNGRMVDVGFVQ